MKLDLTKDEKRLVAYAKKKTLLNCKKRKSNGLCDQLVAFVLSESGKIYDGVCFESELPTTNICGEAHAIANMMMAETKVAKIKSILVTSPFPRETDKGPMPCGKCRHTIHEFGTPKTTVLSGAFVKKGKDWIIFSQLDKYNAFKLYPNPYVQTKWD